MASSPGARPALAPHAIDEIRPRVVQTADELQKAADETAQDIEIRAHLDLRLLEHKDNPAKAIAEKHSTDGALLYVWKQMRSMRGNCSDPGVLAALNLTSDKAMLTLLPPLKPRQCLLLIPDNFLVSNGGMFWLDNLYLRLAYPRGVPNSFFVSAGGPGVGLLSPAAEVTPTNMYITNVTMHGSHLSGAAGVKSYKDGHPGSLLVQDCIFTGWTGLLSPIYSAAATIVNVVDTAFYNMRLPVEIADVSFNGLVRFQNASLTNVNLTHGRIVSTTFNDYEVFLSSDGTYYAEDDEGFDVNYIRATAKERGMPGAEFIIEDGIMSDCIWLSYGNDDEANAGCPPESVQRRKAVKERFEHSMPKALHASAQQQLKTHLLNDTSPWLLRLRQILGELPPPPTWPPFAVDPPANRIVRDNITVEMTLVPMVLLVPWLNAENRTSSAVPQRIGMGGAKVDKVTYGIPLVIAVVVVAVVIAIVATAWSAREVRRLGVQQRRASRKVEGGKDPLRMWLNFWLLDGMESATAGGTDKVNTSSGASSGTIVDSPPRQEAGRPYGPRTLPKTALNPEYEYALPTEIARMMGVPQLETVDEGLLGHLRASGDGGGGSGNRKKSASRGQSDAAIDQQLPNSAATQPVLPASAFDCELTSTRNYARSRSTERGWPGNNMYTAPVSGATASAVLEGSLMAQTEYDSDAPGSTVVVAPYEMQDSTQRTASAHSVHSVHSTQSTCSTQIKGAAPELQAYVRTTHGMHVNSAFNPAARRVSSRGSVVDQSISEESADVMVPVFSGWTSGTLPPPADTQPAMQGIRLGSMHEVQDRTAELAEWSAVGLWPSAMASGDGAGASVPATVAGNAAQATATAEPTVIHDLPQDRRLSRLQRQMDGFGRDDLFLGRFELLGRQHQRRGGQALVQFAEDPQDHGVFAVKFFLDWAAFLTEAALYATAFPHIRDRVSASVLACVDTTSGASGGKGAVPMSRTMAQFLPQVEAVCDGAAGGLQDTQGRPLPPCIVLEKGEALHDWSDRAQPDIFTSLSVVSNLSKRLADMHDAGYVHRDLKPANVMWLPRQNRWTVIDFGCVARVGENAPLSFTLAYAAPEVVRAFYLQQRQIEATPALDAWSLGVMAFELLMGAPAFNLLKDGTSGVMQRLRGDVPLPWEGELSPTAKSRLGAFRQPVLQLLQREPGRRSTMRAFHTACNGLFARTTVEV